MSADARPDTPLACPVRGCRAPLTPHEGGLGCVNGHRFDRARSGYVNLLTPQDRRSPRAGDAKSSVVARRNLHERGLSLPLLARLTELASALGVRAGQRLLDVGAGDGYFLEELSSRLALEGWGVDLSVAAVQIAARRYPSRSFVVANADRVLPFGDASFDFVTSIDACKQARELRRILRDEGLLLLAVPGLDDLAELREAVLGGALEVPRAERALARFADDFEPITRDDIRQRVRLERPLLLDLLAGTYRGARRREQERMEAVDVLEVTLSQTVLALRPKPLGRSSAPT